MNGTMLCIAAVWLCADTDAVPVAFDFVDTIMHEDRSMVHYRAISFRQDPPESLEGDFQADPHAPYGQLPVGTASETALAVVWLPKAENGPTLWLDANADKRLTSDEQIVISGKSIEIPAKIRLQTNPEVKEIARTLLFRRPILGTGLRYAVVGYAAGRLQLGDDEHGALLVDGDADGCFDSVGQDRVWIDLDRNDRFDGLTEQFPLGKPVVKDGRVYVVRSDPLAAAVCANHRKPGEGKLRLTLASGPHSGEVAAFSTELISDIGELVEVDKLDEPFPVPHGKYRVYAMKLQMTDSNGQKWHYTFHHRERREFSVPIGHETTIPLLARLAMQVNVDMNRGKANPSETVTVRPRVSSDDDMLYLSACTIGSEERHRSTERSAKIVLLSPDGETIARGTSGFG